MSFGGIWRTTRTGAEYESDDEQLAITIELPGPGRVWPGVIQLSFQDSDVHDREDVGALLGEFERYLKHARESWR